jgi:glutathione S-transferase
MLRLGGFPISNYYNKVKIALLEKGIPFEEVLRMPSQAPEMLTSSPMGKVPFLVLESGESLSESQVILDYLEEAYPERPLYPADHLAKARCRELIVHLELDLELPARRLYPAAFFGGTISDAEKTAIHAELGKGVRTLKRLAKFSPWAAGAELTAADCAAAVHLPLIGTATKIIYGTDVLADLPAVKTYQKMAFERPSIQRANADRKAQLEARAQT